MLSSPASSRRKERFYTTSGRPRNSKPDQATLAGMRTIVWFRGKDLRISDHAPLLERARRRRGHPALRARPPLLRAAPARRELPHRMQFLLDSAPRAPTASRPRRIAPRRRRRRERGGRASPVRRVEGRARRRPSQRRPSPRANATDESARLLGDRFELHDGETLLSPGTLRTGAGSPYSVFTPFARAFRGVPVGEPLPPPRVLPPIPATSAPECPGLPRCEDLDIRRNEARLARWRGSGPGEARALPSCRSNRLRRSPRPHGPAGDESALGGPHARDPLGASGLGRGRAARRHGTPSAQVVPERARLARVHPHYAVGPVRNCSSSPFGRDSSVFPGTTTMRSGRHGSSAGPAIPWWTPPRGSCSPRASCTTAPG